MHVHRSFPVVLACALATVLYCHPLSAQGHGSEISGTARAYLTAAGNRQEPAPVSGLFLIRATPVLDSTVAAVCTAHHRAIDSLSRASSEANREMMAAMPREPAGVAVAQGFLRTSEIGNTTQARFQSTFASIKAALRSEVTAFVVTEDDGTFTFENIAEGKYFVYGTQPKPRQAFMLHGLPLLGWDADVHWWVAVTVGQSKVRRDLGGNETGSELFCGAY